MSPMHLEVHTLGLSTGLRRDLYRQEKKPKAALRQPERSIRQALGDRGKTRAHSVSALRFTGKSHFTNFGRCVNSPRQVAHPFPQ